MEFLKNLVGVAGSQKTNEELSKILDEAAAEQTPQVTETDIVKRLGAELETEHASRVKAEAEAANNSRRLQIAHEQMAEYAAEREEDMRRLVELLSRVAPSEGLGELKDRLLEAANEAASFARQQREDAERTKKGSAAPGPEASPTPAHPRDESMEDDAPQQASAKRQRGDGHAAAEGAMDDLDDPAPSTSGPSFLERARYIPLRLAYEERRYLRLLEAALSVSEYTDKVDILSWRGKTQRIHAQIKYICSVLSALVVAENYSAGQKLIQDRNFADNAAFFQDIFEVGRRYKIMNPEKMRSTYGLLLFMLMDASDPEIQELLEFKCVRPLRTVYRALEEKGGLALLEDPLMSLATAEIVSADRPRPEIQADLRRKEWARKELSRKYKSFRLTEEEILNCIYAVSDEASYLRFNRDPCDKMLAYLTTFFHPTKVEPGFSLSISAGLGGARLSHNHERQYTYALQSLTLWREIMSSMYKLWFLAESDMLTEGNRYRLGDTGQGLNRIQEAPQVYREMQRILGRARASVGSWVGSSVVHLGDHNVPSALHFIDKYVQVPRILGPIVLVLEEIPRLYRNDANIAQYIDSAFGGQEACMKTILADFFRHAFDGSGADNFVDAGSCIDGRLTSAWNWCSKIEKKSYYRVFLMCGFNGFDGESWK